MRAGSDYLINWFVTYGLINGSVVGRCGVAAASAAVMGREAICLGFYSSATSAILLRTSSEEMDGVKWSENVSQG